MKMKAARCSGKGRTDRPPLGRSSVPQTRRSPVNRICITHLAPPAKYFHAYGPARDEEKNIVSTGQSALIYREYPVHEIDVSGLLRWRCALARPTFSMFWMILFEASVRHHGCCEHGVLKARARRHRSTSCIADEAAFDACMADGVVSGQRLKTTHMTKPKKTRLSTVRRPSFLTVKWSRFEGDIRAMAKAFQQKRLDTLLGQRGRTIRI